MKDLLMKYYKDEPCPICNEKFKENDNIVVCPECGTPYHKQCYDTVNKCVNQEKHGTYFYTNQKIEEIKNSFDNKKNNILKNQETQEENNADKIQCPYCQTLNDIDNQVCDKCGIYFKKIDANIFFRKEKILKQEKIAGISIKDWITYLGTNAMSYIIKFRSIEKKRYSLLEFNFGASIFGEFYFLYRKMYLAGGLFFMLRMLITTFVMSIFLPSELINTMSNIIASSNISNNMGISNFFTLFNQNPEVINKFILFLNQNPQIINYISFGWFVLSILMGAIATRIYKKTSERRIKSIDKNIYSDDVSYRNILIKKGSVNYLAVGLGLLFFILRF